MIDGVKIRCVGTDPKCWEDSPLLSFSTKIDEQTGEIKSDTKTAFFRGLHFFLIPSTISTKVHCILRGSLAKYHNNGRDNGFDYNIEMLQQTILDLQKKFNINPLKAIIQHFEYGLNINTKQPPKTIIRGLRAYQSDCFIGLRMDEVFTGKQLQKQEYQYKVYDKGLQLHKKRVNLLRIELAIKSRKKAEKYGIEILADLVEVKKLNAIKPELLKVWKDMIFHDTGMRWRLMNRKQKEKVLFYLDATNWEKFTRKQRFRAKAKFFELKDMFSTSTTQNDILNLIDEKMDVLTAKNGDGLRYLFSENEAEKCPRITRLNKEIIRGQNEPEKRDLKKEKKSVKAKRPKCKVCCVDISDKRKGSIYCSKHCNNVQQAKGRKKRRRQKITLENNELNKILKILPSGQLKLIITYKQNNLVYSDEVIQQDIILSKEKIKNVQKVGVAQSGKIVLTSYRARKLINTITQINI